MVILQVLHRYFPESVGGIEVYASSLCTELSKWHQVHVFTGHHNNSNERPVFDTDNKGFNVRKSYCECMKARPRLSAPFCNDMFVKNFKDYLLEIKPNIVHIQYCDDLPIDIISVAREAGIPVIVTVHDYTFLCPTEYLIDKDLNVCQKKPGANCIACLIPWPFNRAYGIVPKRILSMSINWLYNCIPGSPKPHKSHTIETMRTLKYRMENIKNKLLLANRIIFPSKAMYDKAVEFGMPKEKLAHISNMVKTDISHQKNKRVSNKLRFGFIGRVVPIKGVHVLIEAFNKLKNSCAELKIYGPLDSDYCTKLKSLAAKSDVQFFGEFNPADIHNVLSSIDVLVLPSVCCENMPLVALEALASKTPIIASDIGGIAEVVINGKNGFLFKAGDSDDLYKKMNSLLMDENLISHLRSNASLPNTLASHVKSVENVYFSASVQTVSSDKSYAQVQK